MNATRKGAFILLMLAGRELCVIISAMSDKYPLMTSAGYIRGETGHLMSADFFHPQVGFGTVREDNKPKYLRDLVVTFHDAGLPPRTVLRDPKCYPGTFPRGSEAAVSSAIKFAECPERILHTI